MLNFSASVPASFVANATAAFEYGKGTYAAISPTYTSYLLFKYGDEVIDSANFTAMGNLALTVLAMPGVKEGLVKAIQAPLGMDEELLNTYVTGALTCLNVAATVLPMVSSYLWSNKEAQQKIGEIKETVKKIDSGLVKQTQDVKSDSKKQAKQESEKRHNILHQYPEAQKIEKVSKHDKPSDHPHRRRSRRNKH